MEEKDGWKRVRATVPDYRIISRAESKAKKSHKHGKVYVRGAHYEYLFENVAGMKSIIYRRRLIEKKRNTKILLLGLFLGILILGIYICIDTNQLEPIEKQIKSLLGNKISYPISIYFENGVMTLNKNNTIQIDNVNVNGKWNLIEETKLFHNFSIQQGEAYLLLFSDGKAKFEVHNETFSGYWEGVSFSLIENISEHIKSLKNIKKFGKLSIGETGITDSFAVTLKDVRILDEYIRVVGTRYLYIGASDGFVFDIEKNNKINGYSIIDYRGDKEKIIFCREFKQISDLVFECKDEMVKEYPNKGAKFLFMYIKIENIGKQKSQLPNFDPHLFCIVQNDQNEIELKYDGTVITPHYHIITNKKSDWYPTYHSCQKKVYPGVSREGWIAFEVPEGIELSKTTLRIRKVIWKLGEED